MIICNFREKYIMPTKQQNADFSPLFQLVYKTLFDHTTFFRTNFK